MKGVVLLVLLLVLLVVGELPPGMKREYDHEDEQYQDMLIGLLVLR